MDDKGLTDLLTAQEFGNFKDSMFTQHIQSEINSKRGQTAKSCISRLSNQYRVFFSDRTALYATIRNDKVVGVMPMELDHKVMCIVSADNVAGEEVIYFGSDNGAVYQLDSGTSFDGAVIPDSLYIHNYYTKSHRYNKKFNTATVQASADGYAELSFGFELDFNPSKKTWPTPETRVIDLGANSWDGGGAWDGGVSFDGDIRKEPMVFKLNGSSESIAFYFSVNSEEYDQVEVGGIFTQYIIRKELR
jgi:hypothetical protein